MPKNNNNNDKKFDLEEELKNEVLKNEALENNSNYNKIKYKKEKKEFLYFDMNNLNLDKYSELTSYGTLENPKVLIDSLNLQEGVSYKYMNTSNFNKAVNKVIAASFRIKVTKYNSDKGYVTSKLEKEAIIPLKRFDKQSIIAHAIYLRAQCFNYLCGDGKPERANPSLVKECTQVLLDNKKQERLCFDYKVIDKIVRNFESDDSLYKSAISSINADHFEKVLDDLKRYVTTDDDGNEVYKIGSAIGSLSVTKTLELVDQYRDLKEIRANRPWHYFITSYNQNRDEKYYLRTMKEQMLEVANNMGFEEELANALNSEEIDLDNCKNILASKMKEVYRIEEKEVGVTSNEVIDTTLDKEVNEVKEEIKVEDKKEVRQNLELSESEVEENEVNPISDYKDELHKYAIHGYAMSEKTVYVTEEEYNRLNSANLEDDENSLAK